MREKRASLDVTTTRLYLSSILWLSGANNRSDRSLKIDHIRDKTHVLTHQRDVLVECHTYILYGILIVYYILCYILYNIL
jgi:hypothetical protein